MNKDEFESIANEMQEDLDQTMEINSLEELSKSTNNSEVEVDSLDSSIEELDVPEEIINDAIDDANLVFKTEIKTEEKLKNEKPKKEKLFIKLKNKWKKLGGIEKALVILGILLVITVIVIIIVFAIPDKQEGTKEKEKEILEVDNYRYEDGKLIFIDKDKDIGEYECTNKDKELCEVAYYSDDDSYDKTKVVDEKGESIPIRSAIFNKRYVFVKDVEHKSEKAVLLYDIEEQKVIKEGKSVRLYEKDFIVMEDNDGKEGLMNFKEDEMKLSIPYEYNKIHVISNTEEMIAIVKKDNDYYLANLENRILTKSFNEAIVGANKEHLKTKNGTSYKVYDYEGKETDLKGSDYAYLLSDYVLSVKDNALYVFDYEGNRYNLNGYRLHNSNYNPTDVYVNRKLSKTEKSFDVDGSAYVMNLTIYNNGEMENISVNLGEGKISKNLMYLNYFDGTLYFYDDTKKENLIGVYTCNNKNMIGEDSKTLQTCRIAKESVYRETEANAREKGEFKAGTIPVFGKRYVFVQDGDTIMLYDLKDSKTLATYSDVDTSSYNGSSDDVIYSDAITIPYIAKSKNSGYFGVAKISSEGVTSVIGFSHKSIKRLGDYFVVEDDSNYSLYNLNGEEKTSKVPARIVDYNGKHIKALKDNQYYVYDFDGKKVRENEAYTYAEIYGDYYAGIVQNTVHVYDYEGNDYVENLDKETKDSLKVQVKNFYDDKAGSLSFKVSKEGKYFIVSIGTVSGDYEKVTIPATLKTEEKPKDDDKPIDNNTNGNSETNEGEGNE